MKIELTKNWALFLAGSIILHLFMGNMQVVTYISILTLIAILMHLPWHISRDLP